MTYIKTLKTRKRHPHNRPADRAWTLGSVLTSQLAAWLSRTSGAVAGPHGSRVALAFCLSSHPSVNVITA